MSEPLTITVLITTYNRKTEIGGCLNSVLRQDYPCEVLVLDDASSDGTTEYIRTHYPQVRVDRVEKNLGLIGQRSRGGKLATGDIIVSIDDDVELVDPGLLRHVSEAFDADDIGAVTFPSIDVRTGSRVFSKPPSGNCRWASADYRGCAHALRRDLFLSLGAYDARLYRQGEESDFAVRLCNAGYLIAMIDTTPVHHHESPRRRKSIEFYYGARNDMLFCWWRIPFHLVSIYVAVRSVNRLKSGLRNRFVWPTVKGLLAGNCIGVFNLRSRSPVRADRFRIYERLRRFGPQPLDEVRRRLAR